MPVLRRVLEEADPSRSLLDVVQFVYGGTGGQAAVARTIAAGFADVGVRSRIILHARPQDMLEDDALWSTAEAAYRIPRHGRFDPRLGKALRTELAAHPTRILLAHLPYGARAIHNSVRGGAVGSAVFVEHHSLARRRWRDDVRSARMVRAVSAVVVLSAEYASGYRFAPELRRSGRDLTVIPNGIDTMSFRPADPSDTSDANPSRGLRIGMAATMAPGKDQWTLIRAVAIARRRQPGIELVLMGDGPRRPALEALASELLPAETCTFTGQLSEEELAGRLRDLDLYVHCTEGETQSVAILQAQSSGLPVIGTRVEGVVVAIEEGVDGVTVVPQDPDALAAAILQLDADRDRMRSYGAAARARTLRQAPQGLMVRRYLELFATLVPQGPWEGAIARLDHP
jgi:glycosyltransferase involved in cell wall biosynthesis